MAEIAPREINREDLRTLLRRGAQLVEVLPREEFDKVHLAGAGNLPLAMISRHTADRFQWDKPLIVYSRGYTCDLSARAAWRLSSLGFTQVYRYTAGKEDWMANGLPVEGSEARTRAAGDLADMDVPTCGRLERVGDVRQRVRKEGRDMCIITNDAGVVLGILRAGDLEKADQRWTVEEAMDRDPFTCRLDTSIGQVAKILKDNLASDLLVTKTDGSFFGVLLKTALEKELAENI